MKSLSIFVVVAAFATGWINLSEAAQPENRVNNVRPTRVVDANGIVVGMLVQNDNVDVVGIVANGLEVRFEFDENGFVETPGIFESSGFLFTSSDCSGPFLVEKPTEFRLSRLGWVENRIGYFKGGTATQTTINSTGNRITCSPLSFSGLTVPILSVDLSAFVGPFHAQ